MATAWLIELDTVGTAVQALYWYRSAAGEYGWTTLANDAIKYSSGFEAHAQVAAFANSSGVSVQEHAWPDPD